MSFPPNAALDFEPSDLLSTWTQAVVDGEATAEQYAALGRLLASDPAARRWFVDYLQLHASLTWAGNDPDAPGIAIEQTVPVFPVFNTPSHSVFSALSGWPVAYLVAVMVLGVGLMVGASMHVVHPTEVVGRSGDGPVPVIGRQSNGLQFVGRITGMVDCRWTDPTTAVPGAVAVPLNRKYALSSGLLEITYNTGAKVVLQGPCTYEVESPVGGFLSLGKLTARVNSLPSVTARGAGSEGRSSRLSTLNSQLFSVRTPTATVTDLGTEFGVEVDETGAVETQVFEGVVEVAVLHKEGGAGARRRIGQGEVVRIAANGASVENVSLRPGQFLRRLPRPQVIRDDFNGLHDYLAEGTTGSIWNGILNAETALRLDTLPNDADGIRSDGQLVMAVPENVNAGWAEPHRDRTFKNAPYLYTNVPKGDFDARVQITSQTQGEFCAAGLMARLDDDNFVSVNRNEFSDSRRFATRSEETGVDSDIFGEETNDGQCALRLVRMGDTFLASFSRDGGQTWTPMIWANGSTLLRRPDLTGPIQLGVWTGTFSPIAGTATFDGFSVQMRGERPEQREGQSESGGSR